MTEAEIKEGLVLYFDKPYTWTSFNLVAKVRYLICRRLGIKKLKVGHAGTLDPLATGVVTICIGKATKRIDELQAHTKEYVTTLQLGATTPSFDLEKPVDATFPTGHITQELIKEALPQFTGHIQQVPPTFSACKVDGHRAYNLARKGTDFELKAKPITIEEIELMDFDKEHMQLTLRIVCGKGTYIRSLARDLGEALRCGAHLITLRRTQAGDIRAEDCMHIEDFDQWVDTHITAPEP